MRINYFHFIISFFSIRFIHSLRQITKLDVGLVKESVVFLNAVFEGHIDHAAAILLAMLAEGEIHTAIHLLIHLAQLDQVKAVIQGIQKTLGIKLTPVLPAVVPDAISGTTGVGVVCQKQIFRIRRHDVN